MRARSQIVRRILLATSEYDAETLRTILEAAALFQRDIIEERIDVKTAGRRVAATTTATDSFGRGLPHFCGLRF